MDSYIWEALTGNPDSLKISEQEQHELDRRLEYWSEHPSADSNWEDVRKRILRAHIAEALANPPVSLTEN